MTSIIGYTRVPFNPSCSIAPVQRLYQNQPLFSRDNYTNDVCNDNSTSDNTNGSSSSNKRPITTFHRMFSRESSGSNGIIELIGDNAINNKDKNKKSLQSANKIAIVTKAALLDNNSHKTNTTTTTTTITTTNNTNTTVNPATNINSIFTTTIPTATATSSITPDFKNYNTHLSIDLCNKRDYDQLPNSYDNLQGLMDSIAKLAHSKSNHFVDMIKLLKQLQRYQHQHRFMSCIDKQKEAILVYFPNTISKNVDQTYEWLKTNADIDIKQYDNNQWHLVQQQQPQEEEQNKDFFDGPKYFDDIHMFINQVDALIESNGLFSHKK